MPHAGVPGGWIRVAFDEGVITMCKSNFFRVLLCNLVPVFFLISLPLQQAVADCRAPAACLDCHATFGYPPPAVLESIAEGTCEVGDFSRGHDLSLPRFIHKAAELPDGRALLTGGAFALWQVTSTTDIFDPADNSITPGPAMSVKRWSHTATTLQDGRVLVAGGRTGLSDTFPSTHPFYGVLLDSAEIYDSATDSWSPTGFLNIARRSQTQTLMPDGSVLLCGGGDSASSNGQMPLQSCESYDPGTGLFTIVGNMTVGWVQPRPRTSRKFTIRPMTVLPPSAHRIFRTSPRSGPSCATAVCCWQAATISRVPGSSPTRARSTIRSARYSRSRIRCSSNASTSADSCCWTGPS